MTDIYVQILKQFGGISARRLLLCTPRGYYHTYIYPYKYGCVRLRQIKMYTLTLFPAIRQRALALLAAAAAVDGVEAGLK
eukprot:COSAG05_NODE_857_length_6940_cov_4.243385_1_plen_80_part_00